MIKNFEELNQVRAKCASCLSAKFTGADGQRHVVLCGGTGCLSSRADEITAEFNKLVKEKAPNVKIVVGGAVITEEYAKKINAVSPDRPPGRQAGDKGEYYV